jgi:hypothetical protein
MSIKSMLVSTAFNVGWGCAAGLAMAGVQALCLRAGEDPSPVKKVSWALEGILVAYDAVRNGKEEALGSATTFATLEAVRAVAYPHFTRLFPAPVPPAPPFVPAPVFIPDEDAPYMAACGRDLG